MERKTTKKQKGLMRILALLFLLSNKFINDLYVVYTKTILVDMIISIFSKSIPASIATIVTQNVT